MAGLEGGLARHLIGCAVLESAATLLGQRGIVVMPLKGIWLQGLVYADPDVRTISDVDVLVQEHQYELAQATLTEAGWKLRSCNVSESSYSAPGLPLPLDLHRRLFTRRSFRLSTAALFARGQTDARLFGARVVLPDPLDGLAHVLGHFVKARGYADPFDHALRDVPLMAAKFAIQPERCAEHLVRCGMARAARYALPLMAANDPAGFARAVLAALPSDALGSALAGAMRRLRARVDARSPWSVVPGFALEPSLKDALIVFAQRAWDKRADQSLVRAPTPTRS